MAPKRITVVGADDKGRKSLMANKDGYTRLLAKYNVSCLIDESNCGVFDFESLVDGGRYTLGEQLQQQQLDGGMQEIVAYIRKQQLEAESLVFSKVKSDVYCKVTDDLGVKLSGAKWSKRPTDLPDMEGFTWFNSKEDSQENRDGYMNYLRKNIQWPDGYAIVDCSEDKNLLSVPDLVSGKNKTSGNIDVVLAETKDVENRAIRQNIRAGFELKKANNTGAHEHQVVLQHLAASSLNPDESVLTVMTDLNERWHFYWFGSQPGSLYKCIVGTGSEAKFLLEHMFDASDPAAAKLFPADFLCRATWRVFCGSNLLTIRETPSNGPRSYRDNNESGNKDDSKEAGVHGGQVAGNTYGMDVANELELLDYVDEEEKREIQLRFLVNHVLPKMTYVPDHETQETEHHELSTVNVSFHNATIKPISGVKNAARAINCAETVENLSRKCS